MSKVRIQIEVDELLLEAIKSKASSEDLPMALYCRRILKQSVEGRLVDKASAPETVTRKKEYKSDRDAALMKELLEGQLNGTLIPEEDERYMALSPAKKKELLNMWMAYDRRPEKRWERLQALTTWDEVVASGDYYNIPHEQCLELRNKFRALGYHIEEAPPPPPKFDPYNR